MAKNMNEFIGTGEPIRININSGTYQRMLADVFHLLPISLV